MQLNVSIDPFLDVIRQIHLTTGRILNRTDSDLEKAIRLVCNQFSIPRDELFTKSHKERFVLPRWCLFSLLHKKMSKRSVADLCGIDRHTVRYGLRRLQDRLDTEPNLRKELAWLENGEI